MSTDDWEDNYCGVCGAECSYDYCIDAHNHVVCLDCIIQCDCCFRNFCTECWQAMERGGLNADNSGWNVCLKCYESGRLQELIGGD